MPKRLVLCSDGTGNSSAKAEKTNVWRIFQALDQTEPDQLAHYDDGVGTSSNKYLAALGGAFGYGLKRNVIDLYKFVCRVWEPGDEIYGFGFSRGAYTIRVVVALIESQGLVQGRSESELHAHALAAYRRYRNETYPSWSPIVWLGRRLRDLLLLPSTLAGRRHIQDLPPERRKVPIRFLGLWDTVAAYGMPVDELKWGISLLIWPMVSKDHHLSVQVRRACHALSLDDERQTFHPILFDEAHEAALVAANKVPPDRLTQVWFSGAHSNVGGGYPEDQQSLVTLDWMISQASDAGLRLDARTVQEVAQEKSPFARLYDARAGAGSYYRYAPRRVDMGMDKTTGQPIRAIVHGSVIARIAYGSDAYAPIALPAEFDVLAPDGSLLPMVGFEDRGMKLSKSTTAQASVAASRTEKVRVAIEKIGAPLQGMVEQIRDTVWLRRVAYFAFLFATLALVIYPLDAKKFAAAMFETLGRANEQLGGRAEATSDGINETLKGIVEPWRPQLRELAPNWARGWVEAFCEQPFGMLVVIAMVGGLFQVSNFLRQRVHDRAWFAWHADRREDYVTWVRDSAKNSTLKAAALLGVVVVVVLAYTKWQTWADVSPVLKLLVVALLAVLLWRVRVQRRIEKVIDGHVPSTPTLKVARVLRNNPFLIGAAWLISRGIVPLIFALALLYLIVGGVSHFVARSADSAGAFCTPSKSLRDVGDSPLAPNARFDTSEVCWATGLSVKADQSYEIELDTGASPPWYDKGVEASVAGLKARGWPHNLFALIKRSWDVDYFVPMIRIGQRGNVEPALKMQPIEKGSGKAKLTFTASRDGELFLYLSDAIVPVPYIANWFYSNNCGSAAVTVGPSPSASAASTAEATPPAPAGENCPRRH